MGSLRTPILVTGGAGFIGSHLVASLVARERPVRVVDDFSTGRRQNLNRLRDRIELIEGDLRRPEVAQAAVDGVRIVLHQAALPSVPRSLADPPTSLSVNVEGTLRLLEAARRAGVERVVYAASSSAYGDTQQLPKVETMVPRPRSPYAASKLAGEHLMSAYAHSFGLSCISLRYFNVFGPRQDPASPYAAVIPRFLRAALEGRPPVIYGDGHQSRDFCYVDNVVAANLAAAEAQGITGQSINVACGRRTSLLELVAMIERLIGRRLEPRFEPARPGDVRHSLASIDRATELLGYRPLVRVEEGLRRTLAALEDET